MSEDKKYLFKVKNMVSLILKSGMTPEKQDKCIYSMLRIAKFINGEDLKNE